MCVYVLCIFALLVLESPEARGMLSGGLGKPGDVWASKTARVWA